MTIQEAIAQRHSVRSYENKPIEADTLQALKNVIEECNEESGLHIQLVTNEPKAFNSAMAHYGQFSGVTNYIALIGKKDASLEEKCGYYGEKIVLEAQRLGLNTCWVALTYKKIASAYEILPDEKLTVVITVGYGTTQGVPHKSKDITVLSNITPESPDWFRNGMEAVLLAPTAVNQQKFYFALMQDHVIANPGRGFYTRMDLGIAKYHFEIGSGKSSEVWA